VKRISTSLLCWNHNSKILSFDRILWIQYSLIFLLKNPIWSIIKLISDSIIYRANTPIYQNHRGIRIKQKHHWLIIKNDSQSISSSIATSILHFKLNQFWHSKYLNGPKISITSFIAFMTKFDGVCSLDT